MRKTILFLAAMLLATSTAYADKQSQRYAVTITNVTAGQTFTPLLVVTHKASVRLFELGQPASDELALIAEAGDISQLAALLGGMPHKVFDTADSGDVLPPGQSVTVHVMARGGFNHVSVVGMLVPTNDNFVALNSVPLSSWSQSYTVPAYDAGSEINDELCASIPGGGGCMGEGYSAADGEGYVHISRGIKGVGDLSSFEYDWHNPVAEITVRRD